jgi:outer membrane receptor protein involved in Fe transport
MTRSSFALIALLVAAPAFAQNAPAQALAPAQNTAGTRAANQAELRLVVVDTTNSGIPTASVTITPATGTPVTAMTDERGLVTLPGLVAGDVKVKVEFVGFETFEAPLRLQRGANNQTVTLKLAGLTDEVVVNTEDVVGAATTGSAMVTSLSSTEIEALPDDPEDLQRVLEELAGPDGATFYLNGFSGGRLPSKDEIRAIRIRSNSFAADGHDSGGRQQIEIITRPNAVSYNGNINFGYQGNVMNARHAQSLVETPEGTKQVQLQFRGPIVRNKTSFSLNVSGNDQFRSNAIIAVGPNGERLGTQVRMPSENRNFNAGIEHALTNNSTLRLSYQGQRQEGRNQGLSNFDLPERATTTQSNGDMFRAQVQGIVGKTMLNEIRFELNTRTSETTSLTNEPTIIVQDAFNRGGAGVNRNNLNRTYELADNFDFTPIKNHQMRVGLLLEGGQYEYFDQTNPLGRWTYASLEDFNANRPLQFSRRLGDPIQTSFNQYQLGFYIQDDIRVNNRLSIGVGLRNEMQSFVSDKTNLMPRIGFSLNPFGTTTSFRGGYGVYYDWYEANLHDTTLRLNGVAQQDITEYFFYDEFGNRLPSTIGGGTLAPNRTVASPDLKMPYVHQASFGVQQQIMTGLQMQLTYQRLEGRNQLRGIDINTPIFDELTGLFARPDPNSGIVTEIQSTGRHKRNQLTFQTRYQWPGQRGFTQFSYQIADAESNYNGATSLPSNSLNPDLDWGPQGQDIRHQAQIGGMLRLPWQVQLQGQFRYRSAPAYNLTTGIDDNRDGVINDRPFGVTRNSLRGDSTWDISQISLRKQIGFGGARADGGPNPGGFGPPGGGGGGFRGGPNAQQGGGGGGFQGGGGGNFRGGNQNNSNSRYSVEFSVQASNPLNRVIRQGYTGNMRSPFFGTATGVASPRRISFNTSFRF